MHIKSGSAFYRPLAALICALLIPATTLAQEHAADTEKPHRTIRWKTASELDNFGFDVFRSESEEGPFVKLNDRPISGAGTTDEPQSYAFVDDTIDVSKAYYYYVESISINGLREHFTPVIRVKPYREDHPEADAP